MVYRSLKIQYTHHHHRYLTRGIESDVFLKYNIHIDKFIIQCIITRDPY